MRWIINLLKGIFEDDSDKKAYIAAMKDIRSYKKSMITCRTVGMNKSTFEIEMESYVGKSKKECKEEFLKTHTNCFTTYVRSFTVEEAEQYYCFLHRLDSMAIKYKN